MTPRVLLATAIVALPGLVLAFRAPVRMPAFERAALPGFVMLMSGSTSFAQAGNPEPGVPLVLAEDRAARVSNVRYELHFEVPESLDAPVSGSVIVRFVLSDASRPLALDFAGPPDSVRQLRAQGRELQPDVRDEHVILPPAALRQGENEVGLSFDAGNLPLNRTADFMYTLFVPARARLAFPCFDQPDLKARYRLTLTVPRGWEGLSNGEEEARGEAPAGVRLAFSETQPISTYLFAFAAGRFAVETTERNGRPLRMLHRETDAQKVQRNLDAIFDLHATALDWLERYTGIPYPFGKFDVLLIPSFQFSGMEHPGAIYYNAAALLLDPSATQNQKLGRASLIAHETAHMWFGDLVTMRWFNDVWMKEVFANFMAAKIVNPSFPEIDHDLRFLLAHYPAAYDVDRTGGTNAIRQRLDNLSEAGGLYGAIIYQKAPIVMRQLEAIVTEGGLREGLGEYLRAHAFGNATWTELIRVLDRRTPDDLAAWSRAWVEEPGRPVIRTAGVRYEEGTLTIALAQEDPAPARRLTWSQHLHLAVGHARGLEMVEGRLSSHTTSVRIKFEHPPPLFVLPSGGGIGYGDFVLDAASRAYLTSHLPDVPDAMTRGAAVVTLWEEMLGGRVAAGALVDLLMASLERESDELNVQRMLSYTQQAYWTFLSAAERDSRTAGLEQVLRAGVDAGATASLKSAWFNALRDTARTPATLAWLEQVWSGTARVEGLTLAEPDYITLALELAVREVPSAARILDEQLARIENPDRRAQFEFVRPALSADAAERDAFFAALRDVGNRRREPWVLQALTYLHHPLRAAAAERHIRPSLEMLLEIQRTGDIFFPKRWMDATLNGHRSAAAAAAVRQFLDELPPQYPERLQRVILSSADSLFRASRMQERP